MEREIRYTRGGNGTGEVITPDLIDQLSSTIEASIHPERYGETSYTREDLIDFKRLAHFILENAEIIDYIETLVSKVYQCKFKLYSVEYTLEIETDKKYTIKNNIEVRVKDDKDVIGKSFFLMFPGSYGGDNIFTSKKHWPYQCR